jgi:hypothetical protein
VATRKTGSRRLVVDGVVYRWRIRKRATNLQADYGWGMLDVAVELAEQPGAVLVLFTDRPHPSDWNTRQVVPIRPANMAGWVREALAAGWVPSQPGPQFIQRGFSPTVVVEAKPVTAPEPAS